MTTESEEQRRRRLALEATLGGPPQSPTPAADALQQRPQSNTPVADSVQRPSATTAADAVRRNFELAQEFERRGLAFASDLPIGATLEEQNRALEAKLATRGPEEPIRERQAQASLLRPLQQTIEEEAGLLLSRFPQVAPGGRGVQERAAELRREGLSTTRAAQRAFRETDLPSTRVTAVPFGGIPLPGGRRLEQVDVGVKGAVELALDPLNILPGIGFGGAIRRGGQAAARGALRAPGAIAREVSTTPRLRGPLTTPARETVREAPEAAARAVPRRRTTQELIEAGGGVTRPAGPAGEFLPDVKIIERNIAETLREGRALRRVEQRTADFFEDIGDDFGFQDQDFLEEITGKAFNDITQPDVVAAIRRELATNETRLASQRARLAAQVEREGLAEADAIQRGIEAVGVEDIPSAPAAASAVRGVVPEQQALQPPAQPPTPPRGPDVPAGGVVPQPAAENILGLRPITPSLSRAAQIANIARRTIGKPFRAVEDNPVAQAALSERSRVAPIIESQSNILGTVSEQRVTQAFVRDERGRIQSLAGVIPDVGAPTIQDVAARLPIYARAMTPEQQVVMAGLRDDVAPFRALLSEVGADVNLGSRPDIIEGGFYLPRGRALEEGADAPLKIRAGGRVAGGGRRGFERTAVFDSQAQGLEVGFEYPSLGDALQSYARDAGQRSTDTHVANFLRSATDEAGVPLGRVTTDVRDRGIIALPDIQTLSFPDEIANAANKILRAEGPPTGAGRFLPATIQAFNNLYRGLRATADNSAVGIQGLLGLASDPRAYKDALKVNLRAWGVGGDRALGKFVLQFNDTASQSGRLTAQQWGTQGLRVGGAQTEFALGRGLPSRIGQLPVIRQANRAFGFFGDTLRLGWADDMLKGELRRGRSLDDLAASGDLERIASSANHMTGWAPGRAGGDIGDLLLFAPRFLQSRLATVANGARGLGPGANLEQRQARNALLKLVGYGTVLTFAVNEMLGNETDVRPIVNGRKNPNFMRIRLGGRDWSVFGTWDSLAGAIISVGQGKPQDILRTMGSGIVSVAWDLISQEDFQGRDVPNTGGEIAEDPGRFAQWIMQSVTPFAAEEIPSAVGQVAGGVREGDVGQIGAGVATIGGEVVGAKSTPLSFGDVANVEARRVGLPDFESSEPFVKDIIETFPSVVQVASKRPSSLYWRTRNEIDSTRLVDLEALLKNRGKAIAGQRIDDRFIANQYFQIVAEASNLKKGLSLGADKEFADPNLEDLTPNERALAMWHALTEAEAMEPIFVSKRLQQRRDDFRRRLLGTPGGREVWQYVLRQINRQPIPAGIMAILRRQAPTTWARINESNKARAQWLSRNLPRLPARGQ